MINIGRKFEYMRGKNCMCVYLCVCVACFWKYAHGKKGQKMSDFIIKRKVFHSLYVTVSEPV